MTVLMQLAFALMALVGFAALGAAARQIVLHLQSLSWEPAQAVVLSVGSEITEHRRGRDTRRLVGTFRYQVSGEHYIGERLSFSIASAAGFDDWDDRVMAVVKGEGARITIWHDPIRPERSVALRDIRWGEIGAALLFGTLFAGGGITIVRALRSKGGPPVTKPPTRVSWRAVTIMWLVAPCALVLAWLLWRDDMPVWASAATLPLLLAINGTWQGIRQRSR